MANFNKYLINNGTFRQLKDEMYDFCKGRLSEDDLKYINGGTLKEDEVLPDTIVILKSYRFKNYKNKWEYVTGLDKYARFNLADTLSAIFGYNSSEEHEDKLVLHRITAEELKEFLAKEAAEEAERVALKAAALAKKEEELAERVAHAAQEREEFENWLSNRDD